MEIRSHVFGHVVGYYRDQLYYIKDLEGRLRYFILCDIEVVNAQYKDHPSLKSKDTLPALISIEAVSGNDIRNIFFTFYKTTEQENIQYNLRDEHDPSYVYVIQSIKIIDRHDCPDGPVLEKSSIIKVGQDAKDIGLAAAPKNHKLGHVVGRLDSSNRPIVRKVTLSDNSSYNAFAGIFTYQTRKYDILLNENLVDLFKNYDMWISCYKVRSRRPLSTILGEYFVFREGTQDIRYHIVHSALPFDPGGHHGHPRRAVINVQ